MEYKNNDNDKKNNKMDFLLQQIILDALKNDCEKLDINFLASTLELQKILFQVMDYIQNIKLDEIEIFTNNSNPKIENFCNAVTNLKESYEDLMSLKGDPYGE